MRISVPVPALLSVPVPEMSAARVTPSVKFATIGAVVEDRRRDQRAAEPTGAEPERAAGENPGVRRLDHAAVGDGERSDQGAAAAAAVADGKPDRCRQARAGAGHQHEGRAVDIVADEGDVGVDHAAVGDRQRSRSLRWCRRRPRGRSRRYSIAIPVRSPSTVAGPPKKESTSAPPWLLSTPPLLMVSAPGPENADACKAPCCHGYGRAGAGDHHVGCDQEVAKGAARRPDLQRAAIDDGERSAFDRHALGEAVDGQRAAIDGERAASSKGRGRDRRRSRCPCRSTAAMRRRRARWSRGH